MLAFGIPVLSEAKKADPAIEIMKSELEREFATLNQQDPPVYYLDYRMEDTKAWWISTSFGKVVSSGNNAFRRISPNLRIGSPEFDNTHIIKGERGNIEYTSATFPAENGENAMRQVMWKQTDDFYKRVASTFDSKINKIKVEDETPVDDFSAGTPVHYVEPVIPFDLVPEKWDEYQKLCSDLSAEFMRDDDMTQGYVSMNFVMLRKYFLSSEAQVIVQNFPAARIIISGSIRSKEGNEMPLYKTYFATSLEKLPTPEILMADTKNVVEKLIELKNAPLADPFTGPAILSPEAAGVFFHEIFGHRVEGHRLKDETDGQTFKKKVGELVLPASISVVFEPQVKTYEGADLNGYYKYDDQGIEGQKVNVVENGVLTDFLMCRTPINGYLKSNGHGRGDINHGTVSRQSNMFISTNKPYAPEELRDMLIDACKEQGLAYGYYFKGVTGGFTNTTRFSPSAFNVIPTEVYKVFVDGSPDELVRGVDLVGTPLSMFSTVKAADNQWGLFNGTCGAESGGVPVATVSPAIFVEKVETQKKNQRFTNGPILGPPTLDEVMNCTKKE